MCKPPLTLLLEPLYTYTGIEKKKLKTAEKDDLIIQVKEKKCFSLPPVS